MLSRLALILIPLMTIFINPRWFSYYAALLMLVAAYELFMLIAFREETQIAYASFGIEMVLAYIAFNLLLLGVRYWLIRRARARILKLPAPKE